MKVRLIANPKALQGETALDDVLERFPERGWAADLAVTQAAGDATVLARAAESEGYDLVLACGGDGTINEVVNGLIESKVALGVIPLGTSNMWASAVGIPAGPMDAVDALVDGESRWVDLGRAGNRYFLVMSGVGLATEMLKEAPTRGKRYLRGLVFLLNGLIKLFSFEGSRAFISVDGRRIGRWIRTIVIGNLPLDRGPTTVTPDAKVDDGRLDVAVFSARLSVLEVPHQLIRIFLRRPSVKTGYEYFQARDIRIWTSRPLDVQTDGEISERTPIRIQVVPHALQVRVPSPPTERPFTTQAAQDDTRSAGALD